MCLKFAHTAQLLINPHMWTRRRCGCSEPESYERGFVKFPWKGGISPVVLNYLILKPFNTFAIIVGMSNHKVVSVATALNHNINIFGDIG